MSLPFRRIVPEAAFIKPAMASAISVCPLPDTPAMAKISPARIEKETSLTTSKRCSFFTVKCSTQSTVSPKLGGFLCVSRLTLRPTIRSAISWIEVSATPRTSIRRPARSIAQRSAICLISRILCVISMMVLPSLRRSSMILSSASISWGVSTAVGSSKIMISALLYSIFRISTRWRAETGRSSMRSVALTVSPYFWDSALISWLACAMSTQGSSPNRRFTGSLPSTMFSATV